MYRQTMRSAFGLAAVAILLTTTNGCVSMAAHEQALAANQSLQEEKAALTRAYKELEAQRDKLQAAYENAEAGAVDAAWLAERRRTLDALMEGLSDQAIEIPGVAVRSVAEGTVFDVEGEVLFESGQDKLTEQGLQTLGKLAPVLKEAGRDLLISGHTDSDPIRKSRWHSNLELSVARGLSVVDALINAGVPAARVGVAGYGQFRPRPNNPGTDEEARKRWNRRVEILLVGGTGT